MNRANRRRRSARQGHAASDGRAGSGVLLFHNVRRARRVRWILFGSLAFCLGFLYWALDLLQSYGLSPGDGGVLRPWGERAAVAALIMVLGLAQFAGIAYYAGKYLVRIELRASRLFFSTIGLFGTKVTDMEPGAIAGAAFHDWALEPGSPVSTPFLALGVAGRRVPFVLDLGAEHIDRARIERLCHASAE